jgi:hypothetical protein
LPLPLTQFPRWGPIALPDIRPFGADCGSPRHRDIRKFAKRVALEFGKGGAGPPHGGYRIKITLQALVWSWYYPEYECQSLWLSIPHRLGKDEALRRLKAGLAQVGTTSSSLPTITVCPVL